MAGHVAQNWNTILPSLLVMYQKLRNLDQVYCDGLTKFGQGYIRCDIIEVTLSRIDTNAQ
jgi:hypothetical protein